MAEIVLKIPEEFEQDFNTDRFKECFERVLLDCKAWDCAGISGNYEHETLEKLLDAFNEAVVLTKGHGRLIDADALIKNIKNLPKCTNGHSQVYDEAMIINMIEDEQTVIEADKKREE